MSAHSSRDYSHQLMRALLSRIDVIIENMQSQL